MKRFQFLLLCSILFNTYSAIAASVTELIVDSRLAFEQGKYSTALIHLKNAAKDNPRNVDVRLELIKLFVYTGQGIQAQTEVGKAHRLDATPIQITILEAKTQMLQGNFDDVIEGFNFIDLPQKDIARIRALQGHAFFEKRNFQQARLRFQRAHLLSPNSLEVKLGQARLFKIDGNAEQEKLTIESILSEYPDHPEALLIIGEYYRTAHQYQKSLEIFEKAGLVQKSNVNVWFGEVRSYIGLEKYDKAKERIQTVLFNYPEHQVGNYLLAVIAFEQKDFTRAKSAIDIVLKGQKRKFEALNLLGTIQFHQKEFSKAERNLKKFLKFNPTNIQARKTLAAVYLKRNQGTLAIQTLKLIEGTNDEYVYSMLASAYQMIGNSNKSELYIAKALKLNPKNMFIKKQFNQSKIRAGRNLDIEFNDPEFNDFLGKGHIFILNLMKQKKYDQALKLIAGYQLKAPKSGLLSYLVANIHLYQEDFEAAKKEFIKSIELTPSLTESRINLAKIYVLQSDDRNAEKLYRQILEIESSNDQAIVSLAGIFSRAGDDDEMMKWLNRSRKTNSASLASREVLVDIYKKDKSYSKAVEVSEEMVAIQPENAALLAKHALLLYLNGRPDKAVSFYEKVVSLKPKSMGAWYGLAKMQSYDNDLDRAYNSLERVLELRPKFLPARLMLVRFDLQRGHKKSALKRANFIVKQNPKKAVSYETVGDVYKAQKKYSLAIKNFTKSVKIKYSTDVYIKLFAAYNTNKQTAKGFKLLKQWVNKYPEDNELKEVLAFSHQMNGDYKKAQILYEEIVKKVKNNDRIFNNLALVTLQQQSPMSVEYADIAYNLNNKNADNVDTLGWVNYKNKNFQEAAKLLEIASKLAPDNPDIRYHFAEVLVKLERIREAKNQLALIVEIEGKFVNRAAAKKLFKKISK